MSQRKKTYTPAPQVDPEISQRLKVMLEVLAGERSVADGARALKLSRNHFQTILHRGLAGFAESITPKTSGRPAKSPEVASLEAELERMRQENARLQERVGTTDRLLQAASGLLQGRIRPARQVRSRRPSGVGGEDKGETEPERRGIAAIDQMREAGLSAAFAAAIAGIHESTVRRWRRRARSGEPVTHRTSACAQIAPEPARRASAMVRDLKGLVGADTLRRSVGDLSRRQAARVKTETLATMERERKAALTRVCVTTAGVVRGMDAMHFHAADGVAFALFSADASIPYRTSVKVGRRYDARLVEEALAADIERNGAPLVYRLDRAKAHRVRSVRELLDSHGVLMLHGPPRCARFYGQLERQNREHRAWEQELAQMPIDALEPRLEQVIWTVNSVWRRRTLGWRTASELWTARPGLEIDRCNLRLEIGERAARIERDLQRRGKSADLAERLAIEQALAMRGYLRQIPGGWC